MTNKKKILLLIGKSATGKDTVLKEILEKNNSKLPLKRAVSVTTRPMRENEIEGEDYYFITDDEFKLSEKNKEFIEETSYKVRQKIWHYGFQKKEFSSDTNYLIIANPYGFRAFLKAYKNKEIDKEIVPIYLICSEEERKRRYLERDKSNENIEEEWLARAIRDDLDFPNDIYNEFANCSEFHVFNTELVETSEIAKEVLGLI